MLRDGCWGYAATDDLSPAAVASTAHQALQLAQAARPTVMTPVTLAPENVRGRGGPAPTPQDPFDLSAREQADFLSWGATNCCRPTRWTTAKAT